MPITHLILAISVILVWGFNFVVITIGLKEISPLFMGFSRFFLTSIPAIFWIKRPKTPFRNVITYGIFMFTLQFAFLFMGIFVGVPPGLASLLLQTHVFFSVLLGRFLLKEKFHSWQIIGALISFSGIALVAMNLRGKVTLPGFFLVIAAAASWGVGNVVSKKIGNVSMVSLVTWGSLVAWPPLLATALIAEGPNQFISSFQHLTWVSGGAILYITYLATLFAFAAWSWMLRRYRLETVTPFTLLVPILAILSSVVVLNEPLHSWEIVATLLMLLGLSTNLFGSRLRP